MSWAPRKVFVPAGDQSSKQRDIAHFRAHGKANVVLKSEVDKMKEGGLYREGDELLTVDFSAGVFIVLRGGDIVRVRYGNGSSAAEFEEETLVARQRLTAFGR